MRSAARGDAQSLRACTLCSGNGLVSYYINLVLEGVGIKDAGTKAAINGGLQVWNLVAAMSGALLVDKLGRRTLFIISNVGMLIGMDNDGPTFMEQWHD